MWKLDMKRLLGVGVMIASAIVVYFLHATLKDKAIPLVLLLISVFIVVVDYPRRYFYLAGLVSYPLVTAINVAVGKTQSLYPIVIFYELSMIAMILFGVFMGTRAKKWLDARRDNEMSSDNK